VVERRPHGGGAGDDFYFVENALDVVSSSPAPARTSS
jgi:hypothetical protein